MCLSVHFVYIGKLLKQCFKQNLIDFEFLDLNIFSVGPRSRWRNAYNLKSHFTFILQATRYCCCLKENHAMCVYFNTPKDNRYTYFVLLCENIAKRIVLLHLLYMYDDWSIGLANFFNEPLFISSYACYTGIMYNDTCSDDETFAMVTFLC